MASMKEIRAKYPQYSDMSDEALAGALHKRFYSDMPEADFFAKVGIAPKAAAAEPAQPEIVERGMLLPISKDAGGNVSFDSDSGIIGSLKRAIMLPGQAMKGEIDPNSPEAFARAAEFATVFSPVNPAVRAGDKILPGVKTAIRKEKIEPPTAEQLKAAASKGYESLRSLDARYTSRSISDMAAAARQNLEQQGFDAVTAPKTFSVIERLQSPPEGSFATSSNLETVRRTFGKIGEDFSNPTDRAAAKFVRGAVDDYISTPPAGSVVPGAEKAAAEAGRVASDARGDYAAGKRSTRLNSLGDTAELRAAAANSGQNVGNAIRQRAASIVSSPKLSSGFNKQELDAIRKVAEGTAAQNVTRYVGNLLGGGGGLGAIVTGMAGAGGASLAVSPQAAIVGAGLPLIGMASKTVSNKMTGAALRAIDKMTRSRSPLYQQMLQDAKLIQDPVERRAALTRGLLLLRENNERRNQSR